MNPQPKQKTIARDVSLAGRGLFGGEEVTITFKPAPVGHGVVFVRTDGGRKTRMPALVQHITKRSRRSALRCGADSIETIEHCMAALHGLGIDNIEIQVSGGEVPGVDGSCLPYIELLQSAGIVEQEAPKRVLRIRQPIEVKDATATIIAVPPSADEFQIFYDLDYGHPPIGQQLFSYTLNGTFEKEIAPARTFCLKQEADMMRARGLGLHLKPGDVLVLDANGPLGTDYRFPDECVRHKVLDLIGDLYLLGCTIQGKIVAYKSGHSLNHTLVRKLIPQLEAQHHDVLKVAAEPLMDIKAISRILPHRYPMLLVDRVLEMDGDRRAIGLKNVSVNEPFFTGHYPGTPVMPGVLIVEAMAQLSGLLLSRKLEHTGKIALLLSLDKVKLRKAVVPGDQLILEAENIRVKARTGHVRCRALVGEQVAAEAVIKFMLVDSEG